MLLGFHGINYTDLQFLLTTHTLHIYCCVFLLMKSNHVKPTIKPFDPTGRSPTTVLAKPDRHPCKSRGPGHVVERLSIPAIGSP